MVTQKDKQLPEIKYSELRFHYRCNNCGTKWSSEKPEVRCRKCRSVTGVKKQ